MNKMEIAKSIYNLVTSEGEGKCKLAELMQDNLKGIFIILKILKEKQCEMTAGSIAQALSISTSRVAVALKTLENKNFITKNKSKNDARCTIVKITNDGITALNERENSIIAMINKLLLKLSDNEAEIFKNIIAKLAY